MNLAEMDFSRRRLSYANLNYINGKGANFTECDLQMARLAHSDLQHAVLRGADLTNADLCGASLTGADLRGTSLCGAITTFVTWKNARIDGETWRKSGWNHSDLLMLIEGDAEIDEENLSEETKDQIIELYIYKTKLSALGTPRMAAPDDEMAMAESDKREDSETQNKEGAVGEHQQSRSCPTQIVTLFAPEDKEHLKDMNQHLAPLRRQGSLDYWDKTRLSPGRSVSEETQARLKAADIVVLLVSASFMADDDCQRWLQWAEQEKKELFPIRVRPVNLANTRLSQLQIAPSDGRAVNEGSKDLAWAEIARALATKIEDDSQPEDLAEETRTDLPPQPRSSRGTLEPVTPGGPHITQEDALILRDMLLCTANNGELAGAPGELALRPRSAGMAHRPIVPTELDSPPDPGANYILWLGMSPKRAGWTCRHAICWSRRSQRFAARRGIMLPRLPWARRDFDNWVRASLALLPPLPPR